MTAEPVHELFYLLLDGGVVSGFSHVSSILHLITPGAHEQKERATYSANTLIINDVFPLYLGMNVRHINLTRITR